MKSSLNTKILFFRISSNDISLPSKSTKDTLFILSFWECIKSIASPKVLLPDPFLPYIIEILFSGFSYSNISVSSVKHFPFIIALFIFSNIETSPQIFLHTYYLKNNRYKNSKYIRIVNQHIFKFL